MVKADSEIAESAGPRTRQGIRLLVVVVLLLVAGGLTVYKLDAWRALAQSLRLAPPLPTDVPVMNTNGHSGIVGVLDV